MYFNVVIFFPETEEDSREDLRVLKMRRQQPDRNCSSLQTAKEPVQGQGSRRSECGSNRHRHQRERKK